MHVYRPRHIAQLRQDVRTLVKGVDKAKQISILLDIDKHIVEA